ncbi:MAG: hypothetical protein M0Q94_16450, partial [Candidatus Cloacimonetes bacterium]|nr:hypothetical protein [Candidatus Cloacimonadota bacterium]
MKSKFKLFITALLASIALSGCGGVETPTGLTIDERTLSWNEVRNVSGYRVLINEADVVDTVDNQLLLDDEYFGDMTFKVASLSGTSVSEYSAPLSAEVYLSLLSPTNLHQDGSFAKWDEVEYANGYVVKVGTIEHIVQTNEYQISSATPIQVSVLANGSEDGYVLPSLFSSSIWFKVALASPSNIAYSDGILSWNSVDNASSYQVVINDGSPLSATSNEYEIGYDYVGSIHFKVKAISGSEQYFDSSYGEAMIQIDPLTLEAPENLRIEGNVLSFDAVSKATAYGIYHDISFVEEVVATIYTIPSEILSQSGSYLQVQARSTIHNSSLLSAKIYLGATEIHNENDLKTIGQTGLYALKNDITLSSAWEPIPFNGVFDGEGHQISGLDLSGSRNDNVGFFTKLEDASVSNLLLSGSIDITTIIENISIGGLAGSIIDSTINSIEISVDIDVVSTNGIVNVGGLTGHFAGGEISNVVYGGSINAEQAISGGLIGQISSSSSSSSIVNQSGAEGSLSVVGGEQSIVGGFVGMLNSNNASITESYAKVTVVGTSYVG